MKVSIITISYNSGMTIKATLDSVINQTYKNIEHIVIDASSNDNTVKICKSYSHLFKLNLKLLKPFVQIFYNLHLTNLP